MDIMSILWETHNWQLLLVSTYQYNTYSNEKSAPECGMLVCNVLGYDQNFTKTLF